MFTIKFIELKISSSVFILINTVSYSLLLMIFAEFQMPLDLASPCSSRLPWYSPSKPIFSL